MKKYILMFLLLFVTANLFAQTLEQKMDALLSAYAEDDKFNGVALVAQGGKIIFQKGYGYRDAEAKIKHEASDIFQIGSITKQITAAVIMQLQEEGKLSVQDKLSKYFSGFKNGDKITIEHLLTHTSGIFNYTNDASLMNSDVTKPRSGKEMVTIFEKYNPDFEPGSKWNYSNSAYSLLGYIIEKVEKKPYEQVVRERVFTPLGMTNTGFDFTRLKEKNKSKGYFALIGNDIVKAPIVDSTIAYAAGAVYSTAEDLLKWERAIAAGKLLKEDSWKNVFTPYKNKYGYGWVIDTLYSRTLHGHSGGIHGFASYLIRFPHDELVVILLDNASSKQLNKISTSLAAIAFNQPYTVPEKQREIALDENILKQYVGEYQLAPNFIITVRLDGKQLKAQATGQPEFEIFPEKENLFFLKVVEAKMEFIKDEKGAVTELILHQNGLKPRGKKIK